MTVCSTRMIAQNLPAGVLAASGFPRNVLRHDRRVLRDVRRGGGGDGNVPIFPEKFPVLLQAFQVLPQKFPGMIKRVRATTGAVVLAPECAPVFPHAFESVFRIFSVI
jgi:hypothetical protein